ncbi:hypothetical protein [Photobacterium galatheae]|nr:hypothetical protein [Photobacterium galatheae]MCM0150512.1 hypothetical protein [Photobacterium galatheae]
MDRTWIANYLTYIGKPELFVLLPVRKAEDKYEDIANFAERTSKVLFAELNRLGAWQIKELNELLTQYRLSRIAKEFAHA